MGLINWVIETCRICRKRKQKCIDTYSNGPTCYRHFDLDKLEITIPEEVPNLK